MRKTLYVVFCLLLVGLTGCPTGGGPSLPATTSGGGWYISTGYAGSDGIGAAPETTVTGNWQADGQGALGDPSQFVVTTDAIAAIAAVVNGRVPATWGIAWNSSLSYPDCDGLTSTATPDAQGRVEEVTCFETTAEAESSLFVFNPNPINLYQPPSLSTIYGSGFTSQYGMPIVQYFSSQGTLKSI
jgi:hypothetical protein